MGAEHDQVGAFGLRRVDDLEKWRADPSRLRALRPFRASGDVSVEFAERQQPLLLGDSAHRADVEPGLSSSPSPARAAGRHAHEDFGARIARELFGVAERVFGVVGEVCRGENFGEFGHEANDTPGSASARGQRADFAVMAKWFPRAAIARRGDGHS